MFVLGDPASESQIVVAGPAAVGTNPVFLHYIISSYRSQEAPITCEEIDHAYVAKNANDLLLCQ